MNTIEVMQDMKRNPLFFQRTTTIHTQRLLKSYGD